jgi:hypothetical protein
VNLNLEGIMLVRFSCGCLGMTGVPGDEEDRAVVLSPCDLPTETAFEPLCVYRRDLSDKTTEPLNEADAAELLEELGKLVAEGYRHRQVRSLLGR